MSVFLLNLKENILIIFEIDLILVIENLTIENPQQQKNFLQILGFDPDVIEKYEAEGILIHHRDKKGMQKLKKDLHCFSCGVGGKLRACSRCGLVYYCGSECNYFSKKEPYHFVRSKDALVRAQEILQRRIRQNENASTIAEHRNQRNFLNRQLVHQLH